MAWSRAFRLMFVWCLHAGIVQAQAIPPIATETVSPVMPVEVVDGAGAVLPVDLPPGVFPLEFFDDFSWRSFIALNWPAKSDVRGVADTAAGIGAAGPRVWETWKSAYEIFQPPPASPTSWSGPDAFDAVTPCPGEATAGSGKKRIMASFSAFGFGDFNQANMGFFAGPLVGQNRRYVRFEIKVNREQYEHIVTKQLYKQSVLDGLTSPAAFPEGAVEVKAAWRQFTPTEEAAGLPNRYYTTRAKLLMPHPTDPTMNTCEERLVGLVGFHIVHKTKKRPQWIWSSFEHIDNVPPTMGGPAAGATYAFNNGQPPQVLGTEPPPVGPGAFPQNPNPVQVVRQLPIIGEGAADTFPHDAAHPTTRANQRYRAKLAGTVWENYKLVLTQWPRQTKIDPTLPDGDPANEDIKGKPFPAGTESVSIGNTTMETYLQTTDCMTCHDLSREQRTDFVFFLRLHALAENDDEVNSRQEFIRGVQEKLRARINQSNELRNLDVPTRIQRLTPQN
jgi:hypothetical protein